MPLQRLGTDSVTGRRLFALVGECLARPPLDWPTDEDQALALLLVTTDSNDVLPIAIAREWLEKGATFVLCTGPGSDSLEQTFDDATFRPECGPELTYTVMTTAHRNEPIESVLGFAFEYAQSAEDAPRKVRSILLLTTTDSTVEKSCKWLHSRK